jgi:hypothetical protein
MADEKTNSQSSQMKIDFKTFVSSLYVSAIVAMGILPDPLTKEKKKNLSFAQETIEILQMLKEKTKGNLDDSESKFLEESIYNLMLQYVEAAKGDKNQN